jgi:4,5-dihydroxyphthalate decarboxylase
MLRHNEFDIAEMSLSSYVISLFGEERPYIAIPVFPSRFFRHSGIYINKNSGIKKPQDLIGKRVGVPEYQITASVWIRGILSDEYNVPVESVQYYQGGEEDPDRPEKIEIHLPSNIDIQPIGPAQTLGNMLQTGEIDALYAARTPTAYQPGSNIKRLFKNCREVEERYFQKTRIFPIMHTIVFRREVYEKNPWAAQSIYKAMLQSKEIASEEMRETAMVRYMLPWLLNHLEDTRRIMGEDYWPYGIPENKATLETFLRYSYEQGLSKRLLKPGEIFAPETFEFFKI